jgi:molybdopterin-containing oxidoreductase family membrane subunit
MPAATNAAIRGLGRLLLVLLGVFFLFALINLLTAQYGRIPGEFASLMVLVNGPLSLSFWLGEIGIGILAPIALLATNRTVGRRLIIASAAVVVGMFFARYNFVVAGQLAPMVGREELWEYFPSLVEMVTIATAAALGLFLYSVGNRLLPLADTEKAVQPAGEVAAGHESPVPAALAGQESPAS